MKLIIDIDETLLDGIKSDDFDFARRVVKDFQATIASAIANGTPIPDNATVCDIEQIRAEIEQIQGNEYEVSDMQGNRYKYETITKDEALQIIDKYKEQTE